MTNITTNISDTNITTHVSSIITTNLPNTGTNIVSFKTVSTNILTYNINDLTHVVEVMKIPVDGWSIFGVIVTLASTGFMAWSVWEMKTQNKISAKSVEMTNKQYIQNEKNKQQEQDLQIYFQVILPLFQRFNDTVDKYWGKDKNHRTVKEYPTVPEDLDYETMIHDLFFICHSIRNNLLILHVSEDFFQGINRFLYNIEYIYVLISRMPSYNTEIKDIKNLLINYYSITVYSFPRIFDNILPIISLHYLGKILPQDDKDDIVRMVKNSENHKKSWEDKYDELRLQREQEKSK